MPRVPNAQAVYDVAGTFRDQCLQADGSLLSDESKIWTKANLDLLHKHFVDAPDTSDRGFFEKFEEQLKPVPDDVVRLAAEVLAVYFLFPNGITGRTKREQVRRVLSWRNVAIADDAPVMKAFDRGIGGTGQAYNQRKPDELWFIIRFGCAWKAAPPEIRANALKDARSMQAFIDKVQGADRRQVRHALVHLLFPDDFEPIASSNHKWRIREAFRSLLSEPPPDPDDELRAIRKELQRYVRRTPFSFYEPQVRMAWDPSESDDGEFTSTDALRHKKQIVLYGPPGTGKTHTAKLRASLLIRSEALRLMKAGWYFQNEHVIEKAIEDRVHRLQLHPGYSYEDFVRGLHVGEGGRTEYRLGYLPSLVERITSEQGELKSLPHILVLDEINRTDLSRMLGECFSLLEDRGAHVELPGADAQGKSLKLVLPANLFVIGTMNLIDQSIEQIDFALRRRFLWIECGFDPTALTAVCRSKWEALNVPPHEWDDVASDFEQLTLAASALNKAIRSSRHLGPTFEVGHTYFFDVVNFLEHDLKGTTRARKQYLWGTKGPKPAIENLWRYSLHPLLHEYLRGLDEKDRDTELQHLRDEFFALRS